MLKAGFEGQMQLLREYLDRTFNNGHVHSNMIYSHFGKSGGPMVFLKHEAGRKFFLIKMFKNVKIILLLNKSIFKIQFPNIKCNPTTISTSTSTSTAQKLMLSQTSL